MNSTHIIGYQWTALDQSFPIERSVVMEMSVSALSMEVSISASATCSQWLPYGTEWHFIELPISFYAHFTHIFILLCNQKNPVIFFLHSKKSFIKFLQWPVTKQFYQEFCGVQYKFKYNFLTYISTLVVFNHIQNILKSSKCQFIQRKNF